MPYAIRRHVMHQKFSLSAVACNCCICTDAGLQGTQQGSGRVQVGAGSQQTCPALFKAAGTSSDWSIGASTPALEVLPRHRQSAAAAANAMLSSSSPLSGLHKLALSICARKKGTTGAVEPAALPAPALGKGKDKENVSPPLQRQKANPTGELLVDPQ